MGDAKQRRRSQQCSLCRCSVQSEFCQALLCNAINMRVPTAASSPPCTMCMMGKAARFAHFHKHLSLVTPQKCWSWASRAVGDVGSATSLPELMAASIWMPSSSALPCAYEVTSMRDTTPDVTLMVSPPIGNLQQDSVTQLGAESCSCTVSTMHSMPPHELTQPQMLNPANMEPKT